MRVRTTSGQTKNGDEPKSAADDCRKKKKKTSRPPHCLLSSRQSSVFGRVNARQSYASRLPVPAAREPRRGSIATTGLCPARCDAGRRSPAARLSGRLSCRDRFSWPKHGGRGSSVVTACTHSAARRDGGARRTHASRLIARHDN